MSCRKTERDAQRAKGNVAEEPSTAALDQTGRRSRRGQRFEPCRPRIAHICLTDNIVAVCLALRAAKNMLASEEPSVPFGARQKNKRPGSEVLPENAIPSKLGKGHYFRTNRGVDEGDTPWPLIVWSERVVGW